MKKLLIVLCTLLVLSACGSNHYSSVSDGDEVFYETPDGKTCTKAEIYELAKKFDIADTLDNALVQQLCELEDIDTSGLQADAEAEIADAEENGYSYYITYYYGSNEAYIEQYIANQSLIKLKTKYINADLDTYIAEYAPFQAEIAYFDEEKTAKKVVKAATADDAETFAYICSDNGYTSGVYTTVYTTSDNDLPDEVNAYIDEATTMGISDVIEVNEVETDSEGNSTTTTSYYVINLVSKDANEFLDDFVLAIENDIDDETVITNFLNNHEMAIYDQDIYEILTEKYEVLK